MTEEQLNHFKKTYKDIQLSEYLTNQGWDDLSHRLPAQDKPKRFPAFQYGFLFAALLLCLTAGIVGASQTAAPGTLLYPVKAASDDLVKSLTISEEKTVSTPAPLPSSSIIKQKNNSPTPSLKPTATPEPVKKKLQTEYEIVPTIHKKQSISVEENKSNANNQKVEGAATEKQDEKKETKDNGNNNGNGNGNNGNGNGNSGQKSDNPGKGNQKK